MSDDPYIFDRIIIAPLNGKTVVVSENSNSVTIDGINRLHGYALKGAWQVESEDDCSPCNSWDWLNAWHGPTRKAKITAWQIDRLNQMLRNKSRFAVLARRQDGCQLFMDLYGVKTSNLTNHEVQLYGYSPYPITRFDGEVEVVGTMDDLLQRAKTLRNMYKYAYKKLKG